MKISNMNYSVRFRDAHEGCNVVLGARPLDDLVVSCLYVSVVEWGRVGGGLRTNNVHFPVIRHTHTHVMLRFELPRTTSNRALTFSAGRVPRTLFGSRRVKCSWNKHDLSSFKINQNNSCFNM